jgi:hypothetical protein
MQSFNLAHSIIHIVLAAFLAFSLTFFLITMLFFSNASIWIIIYCNILCLSVNAHHQLQDHSIRCSGLQHECYPHSHTTDSVLTFTSQHIWINIGIVLGILIIIEKSRTRKSCRRICIANQPIDDLRIQAPEVLPGGAGRVLGRGGVGSGVRCLRWSGGGAPVPLDLQRVG